MLALGASAAVVENRPVEFRVYKIPGESGIGEAEFYRGIQLVVRDVRNGEVSAFTELEALEGVVIHPDTEFSSLLEREETESPGDDFSEYPYAAFSFQPDGTTNLPSDRHWSLTFVTPQGDEVPSDLPPDYRTVVINPFTGIGTLY